MIEVPEMHMQTLRILVINPEFPYHYPAKRLIKNDCNQTLSVINTVSLIHSNLDIRNQFLSEVNSSNLCKEMSPKMMIIFVFIYVLNYSCSYFCVVCMIL